MRLVFAASLALANADGPAALILKALNAARDTLINPAIVRTAPDPLSIDVATSGRADAGCIIDNPFGGCICHADADYSVSLKEIRGLKNIRVTSFDSLSLSTDDFICMRQGCSLSLAGTIHESDLVVDNGEAKAGANACGIKPSVSGSASTHANAFASLNATATATVDLSKACLRLAVDKVDVHFNQIELHDTQVDLDLGPVPGVDVGKLVDLVQELAPDLADNIANSVTGDIEKAVIDAVNEIPCIKILGDIEVV